MLEFSFFNLTEQSVAVDEGHAVVVDSSPEPRIFCSTRLSVVIGLGQVCLLRSMT